MNQPNNLSEADRLNMGSHVNSGGEETPAMVALKEKLNAAAVTPATPPVTPEPAATPEPTPVEPVVPAVTEPATPAPAPVVPVEPGVTEPPEGEPDPAAELEAARQQLNLMAQRLVEQGVAPGTAPVAPSAPTTPATSEPPKPAAPTTPSVLFTEDFYTEEDLGNLGPKEVAGVMNKALGAYTERVTQSIISNVLNAVGTTVTGMVNNAVTTSLATKEFFDANKDLLPYASYVDYRAKQIIQESGGKISPTEVIKKTEEAVRGELRLRKNKVTQTQASSTTPTAPNVNRTRIPNPPDTRSALQKELDEITPGNLY